MPSPSFTYSPERLRRGSSGQEGQCEWTKMMKTRIRATEEHSTEAGGQVDEDVVQSRLIIKRAGVDQNGGGSRQSRVDAKWLIHYQYGWMDA
eukprot:m.255391 g.255391  ORF g.255391 m.255391 type:complete len:92 (+) comp40395_c1_seq20:775-1050(+)